MAFSVSRSDFENVESMGLPLLTVGRARLRSAAAWIFARGKIAFGGPKCQTPERVR